MILPMLVETQLIKLEKSVRKLVKSLSKELTKL